MRIREHQKQFCDSSVSLRWNKGKIQPKRHCCIRNGKHNESWAERRRKKKPKCTYCSISFEWVRTLTVAKQRTFILWLLIRRWRRLRQYYWPFSLFLIMTRKKKIFIKYKLVTIIPYTFDYDALLEFNHFKKDTNLALEWTIMAHMLGSNFLFLFHYHCTAYERVSGRQREKSRHGLV